MRSEYYDPIERFPEKMDRLLEMFDRVSSFLLCHYICILYCV